MKSRRKIWFAPMAALALVLMLVAVVFAASPAPGTTIPDQTDELLGLLLPLQSVY